MYSDLLSTIPPIIVNIILSSFSFLACLVVIPSLQSKFIGANLFGHDLNKKSSPKIPEALGFVAASIYLIAMFLFIPFPFLQYLSSSSAKHFPFHEYVAYLAALLSICCMIFLGFADDVLNLKWRHKLMLPTIASLPLLMVYFVTFDLTTIVIPKPIQLIVGTRIDVGFLYYVYMGMLAVFCTNAINILAGINGIEAGQSFVIGATVVIFNVLELGGENRSTHIFSLYFLLPYLGVCAALLWYNWYPAKVFVGDTFCYFSGMTFAVVAILGHFSKTMLLFMIPQVCNFIFSVPQLFRFVPCPRHRLPKYDKQNDVLMPSRFVYKQNQIGKIGSTCIRWFEKFGLVNVGRVKETSEEAEYECTNMTLINLLLRVRGPMHESRAAAHLLLLQVSCSLVALFIRYPLARAFYDS